MILDPNGITASPISPSRRAKTKPARRPRNAASKRAENVILFRAGGTEPKALPLELVARLEMLDGSAFEHRQRPRGRAVSRRPYADPTLDPATQFTPASRQPILVFAEGERSIGVAVDEIIDIVETVYSRRS